MSLIAPNDFNPFEGTVENLLESDDFEALTYIKKQIESKLVQLSDAQIVRIRQQITEQAALLGMTPAQLFNFDATPAEVETELPDKKTSKAGVPKYRDLATGATWTGRGKPPAWIKAHLEKGGAKEDLRIGVVEA